MTRTRPLLLFLLAATGCWLPINEHRATSGAEDMADPAVIRTGSGYYAYTTNRRFCAFNVCGPLEHFPVWKSVDASTNSFKHLHDAMPTIPSWADHGGNVAEFWAPSIMQRGGTYYLYFTAKKTGGGRCIGVATSSRPDGPFAATASPLDCSTLPGGSIDPHPVQTSSATYLIWSAGDRNTPARIYSRKLTSNVKSLTGSTIELLRATRDTIEDGVAENPVMLYWGQSSTWYLFYAANRWDTASYLTRYVTCPKGPAAPCSRAQVFNLVTSNETRVGPGGVDIWLDGGLQVVFPRAAYHAWLPGHVGGFNSRVMFIADLLFYTGQ